MKYGRILLSLSSLAAGAVGMFFAGRGELLGRASGGSAATSAAAEHVDSAFEVLCKWHAALAKGDDAAAAGSVCGAEAENAALAKALRSLRDSGGKADRERLEAFRAAAFAPGENDADRAEFTLVAGADRRIGIVLKKIGGKWMITRIADHVAPHVDTPLEVARNWHNAIMAGNVEAADANSHGEAQKRENLSAIQAVKTLSLDAATIPEARSMLAMFQKASFSDTGLRATVLMSTGKSTRRILLENINGRWKIVGIQ